MVIKKKFEIRSILIFLFFIAFPFGQLLRLEGLVGDVFIVVNILDVVVLVSALYFVARNIKNIKVLEPLVGIFLVLGFSLLYSLTIFPPVDIIRGIYYTIRLITYLIYPFFIYSFIRSKLKAREDLTKSVLLTLVYVGLFGWLQYFLYPDLRALSYIGWDDHLYRLVGTFLDPGLTVIFLVFGVVLSLVRYFKKKDKLSIFAFVFFVITVAFSYSRAGYLAMLFAITTILFFEKKLKYLIFILFVFLIGIFSLPRPASSGVELERTYSIFSRLENYKETIKIFENSPIFGVGYNNICIARENYFGEVDILSHSCSGSDSSILLILATTGVVGIFIFFSTLWRFIIRLGKNSYSEAFIACLVALFVHSMFVNSLLYPWVLGIMSILGAISFGVKTTSKSGV